MCGHGDCHGHHGHGGECCCGPEVQGPAFFPFRRRFLTREERIAWLEGYLEELRAEVKAVEEYLARMKSAG